MTEQWILSAADVADALQCSVDDVIDAIDSGELMTASTSPVRVTHDEVRRFVAERQRAAFELGDEPSFVPSLLASRPLAIGFHDGD